MFVTHGYNDNTSFYDGDLFDQFWGPYLSVDTLVDFWINSNSLNNVIINTFPDFNNDGNITISKKHFSSLTNNEVWLYAHNNGHNWGDSDIVIEQEIWDFFSLYINNSTQVIEQNENRNLISIYNLLGQEHLNSKNTFLFYQYDNGEVEKKIIID